MIDLRRELVSLLVSGDANVSDVCRRFEVTRPVAYKWLARYTLEGEEGLMDRSRRPLSSPSTTPSEVEGAIVAVRQEFPTWGGRKIRAHLLAQGLQAVPSPSTVTEVLRRRGLLGGVPGTGQKVAQRFERSVPNELWQMDFKGHFATLQGRCHPLTLIDDHSRLSPGSWACADERGSTVRGHLTGCFRTYGMPSSILCDRGGPWGNSDGPTQLEIWLIRLGMTVLHGSPYHPQTQGKLERFHRTLKADLLNGRSYTSLEHFQQALDGWRTTYNMARPHDSLGLQTPASRYTPSSRDFPETLPPIEYGPGDIVRKVQKRGWTHFKGREIQLPGGLQGQTVGFRHTDIDGVWDVRFCHLLMAQVDLRQEQPLVKSRWSVNDVSEQL